jgi:outer membrane receptor protein involved in Fe transport
MNKLFRFFLVLPFSVLLFSEILLGEEAPKDQIGKSNPIELVVSGSLRKLSFSELPSSGTVILGSEIDVSPKEFSEILNEVPAINYAGGSSRPRFFQIRGIGEFEQYEGVPNPSVGIIIDDIDFSGFGIPISLFDINTIEVLRGPQVTAFGANALAGVININTNRPSRGMSGGIELSAGNNSFQSFGLALSPQGIGEDSALQYRLVHTGLWSNGFRYNEYLNRDDTNNRDESTTRLRVNLSTATDSELSLSLINVNNKNGYDAFSVDNSFTTRSDRPGEDALTATGVALKGNLAVSSDLNLELLGNFLTANQTYSYDGDWGNNEYWSPYVPYDYFSKTDRVRDTFSEQIKLSTKPTLADNVGWAVGLFAQQLGEDTKIRDEFESIPYRSLDSDYDADTISVFGEVEVPVANQLSLTLGARVENREMRYSDSNKALFSPSNLMEGGSLGLKYHVRPDLIWYGNISRGFKGGGVNPGANVPEEQRLYSPESLISSELGVRGEFFKNRLSIDSSIFYMRRNDAQLKFAYQNDPADPLSFTYVTQSAAEGEAYGLETRLNLEVTERIDLFGSGALLLTEYTDVPDENLNLLGRENSHAPNWQYSVGARVDITEDVFGVVDLQGKDGFYYDDSHDQRSSSFHLLNSTLGLKLSRFTWTFWIKNILDERYGLRGFYFGVEPPEYQQKQYIQLGDPRTFGTTVSFQF